PLQGWRNYTALPRVAADGNPWLDDATPSGLEKPTPLYPGLPSAATLGRIGSIPCNPERVASEILSCAVPPQPLQGWRNYTALPRVAADGNPWLDDATPSGLSTQHSALSTETSLRAQPVHRFAKIVRDLVDGP